ncbi:MAG: hypothetical protein ACLQGP_18835 [Isosphaeraceae bacterium]
MADHGWVRLFAPEPEGAAGSLRIPVQGWERVVADVPQTVDPR